MAEHWKHKKFVENLVAASHCRDIAIAAREWEFDWYNAPEEGVYGCHLCNAKAKSSVVLRNKENSNLIVIGLDCYDKLNVFLKTGIIASQSADRGAFPSRRQYLRSVVPDKTMLGWLKQRLESCELPSHLAPLVIGAIYRGQPPEEAEADKLVEFYRATRKFPVSELIPQSAMFGLSKKAELPAEITIDDVPRILQLIEDDKESAVTADENERREHWPQDRLRAIYLFGVLQRLISEVKFRLARGAKDEGYISSFVLFAERKVKEFKYFVESMPADCPERSSQFAFTPRAACNTFTPLVETIRKYLSRV